MAAKGALLRIALEIISMLAYSKGFSHSDLGTASDSDVHLSSLSHRWNGNADTGCLQPGEMGFDGILRGGKSRRLISALGH